MDNFFTGNKTSSNYSRTYSKGKSFKFSVWNSQDTYNNDEFVQDFVQYNKTLWAAKKTSTNIIPADGEYWELIVKGVSDIEFRQVDNRIEYRYIDPTSEWKDLVELASVSKEQIKNMLEDLDIKYGNTYDVKLSETSTNAIQNQAVTKKFKKLDEKNTETDNKLSNIKSSITTTLSNAKSYTNSKISETKRDIDSELEKKANQAEVDESVEELDKKISKKVDKVSGKGLSTNDFNNEYKVKLDNLNSSLNNTLSSAKSYTNSEITEVDNKINSEINRAKTSETNLSDRIDDLEEDLVDTLDEAKKYTDLLSNGAVKSNTDKINILNGTGEGSVIKTVKDEISNLVGTAPEKLDTLQEIADYLEEHEDMASGLVNSLSELETKKADKTELNNLKTETDSALQSLDQSKANTTGYYPQLHVGLSDNLPDRGDVTEGLIGFRESAGADNSIEDGTANVQELLGESLVWNQKWSLGVIQGVIDNTDGATPKYASLGFLPWYTTAINGHKILTIANDKEGVIDRVYWNDNVQNDVRGGAIYTANTSQTTTSSLTARCPVGAVANYNVTIVLYDLTQMFGAGKEPSTIEEFNARKNQLVGVDFNAYNAGEVLGVNIKGIKSVNDNAFNGEYAKVLGGREYCADGTITSMGFAKEIGGTTEAIVLDSENKFIPSENGYVYASGTDICIHLVHTGYKDHVYTEHEVSESSFDLTPYFPNGMHGINGVRDSVTPKKATQRIGIRDYIEGDENDTLVMTDGKKTIYELTTPIETEIDPQLNMNYKVWDFGTEELLTDSKSTPVLARTIYGFNATDTIRGNKSKNEEQDVRLQTLESEVVRVGDYQPDLSVGVADQLAGQDEPTASEINFRRSGGGAILDGNARIAAIKGNSVVWNQLIRGTLSSSGNTTITNDGDVWTIIPDGENVYPGIVQNNFMVAKGCKYLVVYETLFEGALSVGINMRGQSEEKNLTSGGSWISDQRIIELNKVNNNYTIILFFKNAKSEIKVRNFIAIDLTKMFGAGNEPTTIEEYNARKPIVEDEYAYNEGEVIHCNTESIKSVGDNAWDEQWELGTINSSGLTDSDSRIRSKNFTRVIPNETYYFHGVYSYGILFYDADMNYVTTLYVNNNKLQIPSNAMYLKFNFPADYGTIYKGDYCINLSDASINGKYFPYVKRMQSLDIIRKYFPDGMKSAGAAHDEIRYNKATQKWEYSKGKIKSVDLGDLEWIVTTINNAEYFMSSLNKLGAKIFPMNQVQNYLSSHYEAASVLAYNKNADKTIALNNGYYNSNDRMDYIAVRDTSYTDAVTFKAAMQGVMLYYESNDWEWVELDKEDQLRNFDYQVWNCGTEQAIANVPSTPLKADIVYGFNAYGTIKQLKEQMATLMTQMAQMQTAMASVTSNVASMGG